MLGVVTTDAFEKPELDIATRCSRDILLLDIRCMSVNARLFSQPGAKLVYDMPALRVNWSTVAGNLVAILPMELSAVSPLEDEAEGDSKRIFEVGATYRVEYRPREGVTITTEDAPHVLGVLGFIHTWPYFRADVQMLTAKLDLPPLTLPVRLSGEVPDLVLVRTKPLRIPEDANDEALSLPPLSESSNDKAGA